MFHNYLKIIEQMLSLHSKFHLGLVVISALGIGLIPCLLFPPNVMMLALFPTCLSISYLIQLVLTEMLTCYVIF